MAGARMESLYPASIIMDGVGLNITVFSYLDRLDHMRQVTLAGLPNDGDTARVQRSSASYDAMKRWASTFHE